MCYAKPGPRCSYHATVRLGRATQAYEENASLENLEELKAAQRELDGTKTGLGNLKRRLDTLESGGLSDPEHIAAANHLRSYISILESERQSSLQAYKEKFGVTADTSDLRYNPSPTQEIERDVLIMPSASLQTAVMKDKGIIVVYDDYPGLSNIRLHKFDTRNFLAAQFSTKPENISSEMIAELDAISPQDRIKISADSANGTVNITHDKTMGETVRKIYYGQPDAYDPHGILERARRNGIPTQGVEPEQLETIPSEYVF